MFHLFEKIWKNRIAKIILYVLSGFILLIFAIWYLSLFNQKVMDFNGDRLKQIELADSITSIARFATGHGVEKRGEIIPLIMFFIALAIYLVDMKYPLFFFQLHNSISVKDPEPSEFYLAMQKLGWFVIYPILLVVLLFKGVC